MNNLNKFLFIDYNNILKNNKFIVFCEMNSIDAASLRRLKKDLKKNNFLLKNVRTDLIKFYFTNKTVKNLIKGPIFIIYKDFLKVENDFSTLKHFSDYKFILGCFFYNKLYPFIKFKQLRHIKTTEQLYNKILNTLYTILSFKFYNTIKQISNDKNNDGIITNTNKAIIA